MEMFYLLGVYIYNCLAGYTGVFYNGCSGVYSVIDVLQTGFFSSRDALSADHFIEGCFMQGCVLWWIFYRDRGSLLMDTNSPCCLLPVLAILLKDVLILLCRAVLECIGGGYPTEKFPAEG